MRIGPKIKLLAFTVLELLIVISIIAVLAALLVPGVQEAKESANRAKCMSNIRQVGQVIELYKEDNNQYYPLRAPTSVIFWQKDVTMNVLGSNYTKANWGIFRCPSNKCEFDMPNRTNTLGGRMDYEMNSGIYAMQAHGTNGYGEIINIPTLSVVIYDWPGPNQYPEMGGSLDPNVYPPPHRSGGINAFFVDGHVAWISKQEANTWKEGQSPFYKWGRYP